MIHNNTSKWNAHEVLHNESDTAYNAVPVTIMPVTYM